MWQQIRKDSKKVYNQDGITKMHIFLASGYIFGGKIIGSYKFPESKEEAIESINHFKFLTRYSQYLNLL
ncbi:MAG: hypothetical protein CMH22_05690 [Methylophaga sp.]|nr:hypothetical protein [Methylophaga sp.]|tara:strand:+ start:97827 stop:98033 length:207 start_codon:yes stop_codon:yes gene_type:complete